MNVPTVSTDLTALRERIEACASEIESARGDVGAYLELTTELHARVDRLHEALNACDRTAHRLTLFGRANVEAANQLYVEIREHGDAVDALRRELRRRTWL